jgi:hypothetical protein
MINMPVMKPIPIPTRKVNAFKRMWVWLVSTRQWEIYEDYVFEFDGLQLFIPKGFVFDGASIPKPFRAFLAPVGLLLIPSVFHDFGYQHNHLLVKTGGGTFKLKDGAGKAYWDKLFFLMGQFVNGVHFANYAAWIALTCGGWLAWLSKRSDHGGVPPLAERGEELDQ